MNLDHFHERRYDRQSYNCAHFVAEVWQCLTEQDITQELGGFLRPPTQRNAKMGLRRVFIKLAAPVSPCIALMQRHRTVPHVGVYLDGGILHIHEHGVEFMSPNVASRGFASVKYFTC